MRASVIFGYVLVETLVFYAVAKWLGVGTALLLLLGVFFGGFLVALGRCRGWVGWRSVGGCRRGIRRDCLVIWG